ncbi:unnamed protein product [Ranitomeya imitator]|uniref:Uncharacterized protein n=1 Tax=Ranitomeya imitator TaxID=111125 RepID=A0ABN9MP39_9NEOB|nr:unnamed protein product [Ranitomeya imitator]
MSGITTVETQTIQTSVFLPFNSGQSPIALHRLRFTVQMEKRVVLITGCSSGIGLGLAVLLASDSGQRFKVYATMRDLSKKEYLLECVRGCHADTFEILQMDVTDQQSVLATIEKIKENRVDILVCNAGIGLMGPLECHTYYTMKKIFDVNLFGTIGTIQAFLPGMKQRRSGRIIISSSVGGLQGSLNSKTDMLL